VSGLVEPFEFEFMQRALLEITLLAPMAGVLGAQIVLRRLAFFTHSIGTAAFPGLVMAGPTGVPAGLMALGAGGLFAAGLEGLGRVTRVSRDVATGLLLVGGLALGIVLASDVFESGSGVDRLLFGSLLAIGPAELGGSAIALAVVAIATLACRRTWVAAGFDPAVTSALGLQARGADLMLMGAIAVAAVAALDAVGALLVSAILVIPAATARLFARSVSSLEAMGAAIALTEGVAGLWISYRLDVPPGAAIAVLGGAAFGACLLARGFTHGFRNPNLETA